MSKKSVNSDSAKKFKKIRNDLMNFEKDEIIKVKNSNKNINITKFEDSDKKVTASKYSSTTKKLKQINNQNPSPSPNIEIIKFDEDKKKENDDVCSSDLSDDDED